MGFWDTLLVTVVGGLLVLGGGAGGRWLRDKQTRGFSSPIITRNAYLKKTLELSLAGETRHLDAYLPALSPAAGREGIREIQAAWSDLAHKKAVRIITSPRETALQAAAELADRGVPVHVARAHDEERLSYHLFTMKTDSVSLLNHRPGDAQKANAIEFHGISISSAFASHFENLWGVSQNLVNHLATRCVEAGNGSPSSISQEFHAEVVALKLSAAMREALWRQICLLSNLRTTLIVGLPGSGKSRVRALLEEKMKDLEIRVTSISDYPALYRAFLEQRLNHPDAQSPFRAFPDGAFQVEDPHVFQRVLDESMSDAFDDVRPGAVSLFEFARARNVDALRHLSPNRRRMMTVFYVQAPLEDRMERLKVRSCGPRVSLVDSTLTVHVSDDHALPERAHETLYNSEDLDALRGILGDRLFVVNNPSSDPIQFQRAVEAHLAALATELLP